MKNVLRLTGVLMFLAFFFLVSCSKDDMKGKYAVNMRAWAQADAGSDQLEEGTEIKKISNEVSVNWNSTVFKMEEGKMVACDCKMDDFDITQVFLKQNVESDDHTFLYQNGVTTGESHLFTGDDIIGIDMNYNGEYVRMSDIDVFGQSQDGQYLYADELGVEVFANGSSETTSAVYNFPILSNEDDPGSSLSGLWMRIVLDFN